VRSDNLLLLRITDLGHIVYLQFSRENIRILIGVIITPKVFTLVLVPCLGQLSNKPLFHIVVELFYILVRIPLI